MNAAADPAARRRAIFLVVAATFLLPLAVAIYLYYAPAAWRPAGAVNHGMLIEPARPLPALALATLNGSPTAADFLRHRWTLIYIGAGSCDARCHEALYQIRQVRLALNQDADRVQRLFLATDPCCDRDFLKREHPGLVVALGRDASTQRLIQNFPADTGALASAGRIYVVDPLGNLMMAHPRDSDPRHLLEDLKRLLKLSQIG
ncbi:MAG TPA: SCO family protein [Burkholderiales bacterium]|nr:SCO family protein [Burkholderiales bacterium]